MADPRLIQPHHRDTRRSAPERELTTWDVNPLNPMNPSRFMRRVTRSQAELHYQTKQLVRSLPRNIFGIAILKALGMQLPRPPSPTATTGKGPVITQERINETNRKMAEIHAELAAEGLTATGRIPSQPEIQTLPDKGEQLQDSVKYAEAQTTFEAHMRASQLRDSIKA